MSGNYCDLPPTIIPLFRFELDGIASEAGTQLSTYQLGLIASDSATPLFTAFLFTIGVVDLGVGHLKPPRPHLLVGFGLNHSAQIPIRRGAPLKVVVADPAPLNTLYSFVPSKAKNPAGGALLAIWLATPEGAKAYEDATDRGNPFIEGTKTHALLKGRQVSQFPVEQAPQEAAIVQRVNKMIESRETQ